VNKKSVNKEAVPNVNYTFSYIQQSHNAWLINPGTPIQKCMLVKHKLKVVKIVVVVVIAQQLISYRQLSRLRKSATAAVLSHRWVVSDGFGRWMFYGVWCHSTLRTNIWYAAGNAGLVSAQEPTVTRTQLGKCDMDRPRQQRLSSLNSSTISCGSINNSSKVMT